MRFVLVRVTSIESSIDVHRRLLDAEIAMALSRIRPADSTGRRLSGLLGQRMIGH